MTMKILSLDPPFKDFLYLKFLFSYSLYIILLKYNILFTIK